MQNKNIKYVLGFDYGTSNIGVATGNKKLGTASPICVVSAKRGVPVWTEVATLVNQWRPDAFIVGLPLNEDNSESNFLSEEIKIFAAELNSRFCLPYFFCNERCTTKAARSLVHEFETHTAHSFARKKKRAREHFDDIAASLIVQQWLDSC